MNARNGDLAGGYANAAVPQAWMPSAGALSVAIMDVFAGISRSTSID